MLVSGIQVVFVGNMIKMPTTTTIAFCALSIVDDGQSNLKNIEPIYMPI